MEEQEPKPRNWDGRYLEGDTPWEEPEPCDAVIQLCTPLLRKGVRVLDVGCGLGTNARWLARQGCSVTALDISAEAIRRAQAIAADARLAINFVAGDFLANGAGSEPFDLLLDRGCFHSFKLPAERAAFAARAAECLIPAGTWINLSGNKDHPDNFAEAQRCGYPRLSAEEILAAVEPHFELLELHRCTFGNTTTSRFLAFGSILKKREKRR